MNFQKLNEAVDTFIGRVRFADIDGVTSKRRIRIVDLRLVLEL